METDDNHPNLQLILETYCLKVSKYKCTTHYRYFTRNKNSHLQ